MSARWGTSSQKLDCRPPDLEEPPRRTRAEGERHVSESLGRGDLRKCGELNSDAEFGTRSADRDERRFVERIGGSTADARGRSEFGTAGRSGGELSSVRLGLVKIEAVSFAEALKEIRRRFGDDVSIVHTRVIRRRGVLGVLGATGVEVYVTGRSEFEAWRGHADDRSLPPTRRLERRHGGGAWLGANPVVVLRRLDAPKRVRKRRLSSAPTLQMNRSGRPTDT